MIFPDRLRTKAIAQLCCVVIAALAFPAFLCRSSVLESALRLRAVKPKRVLLASGGVNDAESGRALLRKEQPDWVLVGNSMLNSRIETDYLKKLSGHTPFKLTASGTKSAMWFLFLKLVVIESGVKPKCVTVFFRDRDLTWPENRMDRNEEMIVRMEGRAQPEWKVVMGRYDAAANMSFAGVVKNVGAGLGELLPGEKLRNWGRGKMQKTAFNLTSVGNSMPDEDRREELNDRLSLDHQRQDLASKKAGNEENEAEDALPGESNGIEPIEFDPSPTESFLPHMVALAQQHGFKLHFHRVKRRPDPPVSTPAELALPAYIKALQAYVESQGCLFSDESQDEAITYDMYVDGDHINRDPKYQQPYMDTFWRHVQSLVDTVILPAKSAPTPSASPR